MSEFINVHNITAGAGAGKTTELVKIISGLVDKGEAPERMILTTYTDAAATELKDRIKAELYQKGNTAASLSVEAARMGTVHSVANAYIKKYWYLIGLSPDLKPLADSSADQLIVKSLNDIASREDVIKFHDYVSIFGINQNTKDNNGRYYDFWKDMLLEIRHKLMFYEENAFDIEDIKKSTSDFIKATFNQSGNQELADKFLAAAQDYLALESEVKANATSAGIGTFSSNKEFLNTHDPKDFSVKNLEEIGGWKWGKANNSVKEALDSLKDAQTALSKFAVPDEHVLIGEVTERILDIYPEWMEVYRKEKAASGLIDYQDMEEMFLRLLGMEAVQKDIEQSIDYLFVDELQDSTPIQMRIFRALSRMVRQSYFVGDRKQSIYGFNGTDSELISSLCAHFPVAGMDPSSLTGFKKNDEGNSSQILSVSHRSVPSLVDLANKVFVPAFAKDTSGNVHDAIPEEQVVLSASQDKVDPAFPTLRHVNVIGGNNSLRASALATYVCKMTQEDWFKDGGYTLSDIAILARKTNQVEDVAAALAEKHVPIGYFNKNPDGYIEVQMVLCLLKLAFGISCKKSRAELLKIVGGESFADLVGHVKGDGIPEFLTEFSKDIKPLPVSAAISAIIARFGLYDYTSRWGDASVRRANLNCLRSAALSYESEAANYGGRTDVRGFLEYWKSYENESRFDNKADGVKVLTYHKAKGLGWKIVILYGIADYNDSAKIGNIFTNTDAEGERTLIVLPSLPDNPWVSSDQNMNMIINENLDRTLSEEKRILYVGLTRAKDVVITIGKENEIPEVIKKCCPTTKDLLFNPSEDGTVDIWGVGTGSVLTTQETDDDIRLENSDEIYQYRNCGPNLNDSDHRPRGERKRVAPSLYREESIREDAKVQLEQDFDARMDIDHSELKDNEFGDCIHHIFASYRAGEPEQNLLRAKRTLEGYGLVVPEAPKMAVKAMDSLCDYLTRTYGECTKMEHELPFQYTDEKGHVFSGDMDLVWNTAKGCVLVDYKTFPGTLQQLLNQEGDFYAGKYASQLSIYKKALSKRPSAQGNVLATLLYYTVQGRIISLELPK